MTHFNNQQSPVLSYDPYRGDFEFRKKKPDPKRAVQKWATGGIDIDKINLIMFMRGLRNIYNDFLVKPMVKACEGVNFWSLIKNLGRRD
jgi:hypothetical protein